MVSEWYEARKAAEPDLKDLAMLEGLLAERRKLLKRLMKLDDDMLDRLISARSGSLDGYDVTTP